jgi:alpha-1,3-rhamnosyl/mannosyltransferase
LRESGVRPPYVLYVGGHVPRKRLAWAIDVWADATPADVQLVTCGVSAEHVEQFRQRVPEPRRAGFLPLRFVAEEAMPGLYAGAVAVLYPTTYEGFGFPALEAQAMGRPLLMSAVGSLAELVGPSAQVLPVDDRAAWAACLGALAAEPPPPSSAARAWAAGFSWHRVAERIVALYREAGNLPAR